MKILITGAGGMLGTDLASLLSQKFNVSGVGRSPAPHLSIPYQQLDLAERQAVFDFWQIHKPELVFHAAAMTDVDGCETRPHEAMRNNSEATKNVTDACNRFGGKLIFFSTDYVFDGQKKGEYVEEDTIQPLNIYGETKALAEKYIRENSKQYAIFRISWLYGLRGKSFPRTMLERGATQKQFQVVSDQIGRPTYTRDIAKAFLDILSSNKDLFGQSAGEVYHLTNQGQASWADFASFILTAAYDGGITVTRITSQEFSRPAKRPKNSLLSIKKAQEKLGLSLRPWREAVVQFMNEIGIPRKFSEVS